MKFGRLLQDFTADSRGVKRSKTECDDEEPKAGASFLDYKRLKKTLKKASEAKEAGNQDLCKQLEKQFVDQLHADLDNINSSFIEQEEEAVIKMQTLRDEHEAECRKRDADETDRASWLATPAVRSIRGRFIDLHGELVLLLHWSIMNYAGTLKILKKHDKLLGGHSQQDLLGAILRMPFTSTASVAQLASDAEAFVKKLGGAGVHAAGAPGASPTASGQLTHASSLRDLMDEAEKWAQEKDSGNSALLGKTRAALAMLNELQESAHTPSTLNRHEEIASEMAAKATSISA